ncbi:MAG: hypothetical protein K0S80_4599 [Neobacillus sp.]|jgi:hypothetical protein|nr:hypothetical protein [Neobacillus sp.]
MHQPATIADFQSTSMNQLRVIQSPEKRLIANLAEQANTIIEHDGFNDEVKDIVQAIATLKQN